MAILTKPASPGWKTVKPRYRRVKARFVAPFSLQSQTQIHPGEQWTFEFTLPPLTEAQAQDWIDFLWKLARNDDHWVEDVSRYVPAAVANAEAMSLRLPGGTVEWDVGDAVLFGIAFSAEEVL